LPVLNWWELHKPNNYEWLLIDRSKELNKYHKEVFKDIRTQFTNEFGIDKKFEKYLDKITELTLINIDIAITGDRSQTIFASMIEVEIEDLLSESEKKAVKDNGLSVVSKYLGSNVKVKDISVYEFYNHVRSIEQEIKATNGIR
jgi:hypothetical protein